MFLGKKLLSLFNVRVNFKNINFKDNDENKLTINKNFDHMEEELIIMVTPQPLLKYFSNIHQAVVATSAYPSTSTHFPPTINLQLINKETTSHTKNFPFLMPSITLKSS